MTTRPTGRCPYPNGASSRKSGSGENPAAPAIEQRGEVWHLRSYAAVRQVLRNADGVRQAVQTAIDTEATIKSDLRQPVILQDGAPHKEQRAAIARFFTPKAVHEAYQGLMETLSDEIITELRVTGRGDLSAMSMRLAVQVAAQVVGLTDSRGPGMDRRIAALLSMQAPHPNRLRREATSLLSKLHALHFYLRDVQPAIATRRKAPRDDVISHLLGKGYKRVEILIECMTYAVAGMVTTREFICMAAWHLLEDPELRSDYLAADEAQRQRILHEILRLEPVAGHLYRRASIDLSIEHAGETHRIPAGALLDLHIYAANADREAVGDEPLTVCPHRDLARGVQPPVLSFGDGAHRCPGAFLAIQESDIFLHRLLRLPLRVERAPSLTSNDVLQSYELRDFVIEIDSASSPASATPSHDARQTRAPSGAPS